MSPSPLAACHTAQGLHHVSYLVQIRVVSLYRQFHVDMSSKETFTFVSHLRSHPGPSIKLMLRQVAAIFFQQICPERAERSQGSCKRGGRKAAGLGLRVGCELESYVNLFSLSLPICTQAIQHPPQETCWEEEMQEIKGNLF